MSLALRCLFVRAPWSFPIVVGSLALACVSESGKGSAACSSGCADAALVIASDTQDTSPAGSASVTSVADSSHVTEPDTVSTFDGVETSTDLASDVASNNSSLDASAAQSA